MGAAFNGASFLDFNNDISSLILALLACSPVGSYALAFLLLGTNPSERAREGTG